MTAAPNHHLSLLVLAYPGGGNDGVASPRGVLLPPPQGLPRGVSRLVEGTAPGKGVAGSGTLPIATAAEQQAKGLADR